VPKRWELRQVLDCANPLALCGDAWDGQRVNLALNRVTPSEEKR